MDRCYIKGVAMVVAMLLLHSNCHGNRLLELKTAEEYMNVCMDGILHKLTPGPESELFKQVWRIALFL